MHLSPWRGESQGLFESANASQGLCAAFDSQFAVDGTDMRFHSAWRYDKQFGDLSIRASLTDMPEYFALTFTQRFNQGK